MSSDQDHSEWQLLEDECYRLEHAIKSAASESGRNSAVSDLLRFFDSLIQKSGRFHAIHVFMRASQVLHDEPMFKAQLWSWLKTKAAESEDLESRIAMRVGILELLPEEPVSWEELGLLFCDWSRDPRTRWAVLDTYELHPDLIRQHLSHFQRKCLAEGKPPPQISELDIRHWLETRSDVPERSTSAVPKRDNPAGGLPEATPPTETEWGR